MDCGRVLGGLAYVENHRLPREIFSTSEYWMSYRVFAKSGPNWENIDEQQATI
jgi:hypothetical protein